MNEEWIQFIKKFDPKIFGDLYARFFSKGGKYSLENVLIIWISLLWIVNIKTNYAWSRNMKHRDHFDS